MEALALRIKQQEGKHQVNPNSRLIMSIERLAEVGHSPSSSFIHLFHPSHSQRVRVLFAGFIQPSSYKDISQSLSASQTPCVDSREHHQNQSSQGRALNCSS